MADSAQTLREPAKTSVTIDRGLLAVLTLFTAVVASHLDVTPIWDAHIYYACIEEAVHKSFELVNFRCVSHPSIFYALLLGVTQYLAPWTPAWLYVVNAAVGLLSIVAFHRIVRLLYPDRPRYEYALVTALYGLAPLFVANAVFLTLDYAATALVVLFVYFLLARRPWAAGAVGAAVAFTKETGGAAVALAAVAFTLAFIVRPSMPRRARVERLRGQLPIAIVPAMALLAFVLLVRTSRQFAGWANTYATVGDIAWGTPLDAWLNTNLADRSMQSFLVDMFVLNFQWLFTTVIVAAIAVHVFRPIDREPSDISAPRLPLFGALLVIGLAYVTTRYRGYNNARYVLTMTPALVATFYGTLLWLVKSGRIRLTYLGGCALLVVVSNFRTVDPVSKAIFGTFEFGSHQVLDMPSIVGGLKLDSMVYNLEFLQLEYLYGDMIREIRPRPGAVILMGNAVYNFPPDVDGRTYALTANPGHVLPLFVSRGNIAPTILADHFMREGELFYYAAFANADNDELAALRGYELVDTRRFNRQGYTLDVYAFRFRFRS